MNHDCICQELIKGALCVVRFALHGSLAVIQGDSPKNFNGGTSEGSEGVHGGGGAGDGGYGLRGGAGYGIGFTLGPSGLASISIATATPKGRLSLQHIKVKPTSHAQSFAFSLRRPRLNLRTLLHFCLQS